MLGFALSQSWSGMTSTLISSSGVDVYIYYCTGSWWYSLHSFSVTLMIWMVFGTPVVSAITSLFCVNWWVFVLVHDIPMQFWIEKSLPKIMGLFKCSHTMNVW